MVSGKSSLAITTSRLSGLITIAPDELECLAVVRARFGLDDLGEGDAQDGLCVLAAMAVALSNLAEPLHMEGDRDASRAVIGLDCLVDGSLASVLVNDFVIGPMREAQLRVSRHIEHYRRNHDSQASAQKSKPRATEDKALPSTHHVNLAKSIELKVGQLGMELTLGLQESVKLMKAIDQVQGEIEAARRDYVSGERGRRMLEHVMAGGGYSAAQEMADRGKELRSLEAAMKKHQERRPMALLLDPLTSSALAESLEFPLIFLSADSERGLEQALAKSHRGAPLVHFNLRNARVVVELQEQAERIMSGGLLDFATGVGTVKGRILAIPAPGVLEDSARSNPTGSHWLGNLMWLTSGSIDIDFPEAKEGCGAACESGVRQKFADSVWELFTQRLELKGANYLNPADYKDLFRNWHDFLRSSECLHPGITGKARNLLPALLVGLDLMADRGVKGGRINPKSCTIPEEALAIAKWLVVCMTRRMQQLTAEIYGSQAEERTNRIAAKLLEGGPMTARDLVRRFSRMSTASCIESLEILESHGVVERDGSEWRYRESAVLNIENGGSN